MVRERLLVFASLWFASAAIPAIVWAQATLQRTSFRVKYVAEDAVYLDGGRAAGLKQGQKLVIERAVADQDKYQAIPPPPAPSGLIATLTVVSVAASSAVCEITSSGSPIQVGDAADLTAESLKEEAEQQQTTQQETPQHQQEQLAEARDYPVVIGFEGGDPVQEEARASVPRPPSPEINRIRGRVGVEYDSIVTRGAPSSLSSEVGLVARVDMTRIAGTYWNFNGYWRGRFTSLSGPAAPATITDLINRTYTLNLQYNNPTSPWVAGGGRLYLPWATSLEVLDGGYAGHKIGEHTTMGIFGGSTPDPSSYDYNPNGKLGGAFLNVQGGDFERTRYSTTFGMAVSAIGWHANRQFGFAETSLSFSRNVSIYDAVEADLPHTAIVTPTNSTGAPGTSTTTSTGGLNRNYFTIRYQPLHFLQLDLNDSYYRDFPTFDLTLIGTGLLDRYLFQGLSGGAHVDLPKKISFYTSLGKSSATGDASGSWNQMYGITLGDLLRTGLRLDARYSKFNSSFGKGDYKAILLSRTFAGKFDWNLQGGFQNFSSTLTSTTQSHFINTYFDWTPGRIAFFQAGYTWQRGGTMNYDQFEFIAGKRF